MSGNAIERLRDHTNELRNWHGWRDDAEGLSEDVAAVEALYQAAKEVVDAERADDLALEELLAGPLPDPNHEEELLEQQKATRKAADKAWDALAAAVRRVEGTA